VSAAPPSNVQTAPSPGRSAPAAGLEPTAIGRRATIAEVAWAALRSHLAAFLEHEPGARSGEDPEGVHDMRVASRRMRAAIALFRQWLPDECPGLSAELKWVSGALGAVRDLDVQLEQVRTWRSDMPADEAEALDPLITFLLGQRDQARAHLTSVLDSPRYERLVTDLTAAALSPVPPAKPARSVAPRLIRRRYRKIRKAGKGAGPESAPEDLHALRIRDKRLRYGLEFLQPVYPGSTRPLIRRLVAVQDLLGDHQDAHAGLERTRAVIQERPEAFSPLGLFALGRVAERYETMGAACRTRFPEVFRGVRGKPWKRLKREMRRRER
jgi:triphosphatase